MKSFKGLSFILCVSLVFSLMASAANACLWIDGTTIDGGRTRLSGHFIASQLRSIIAETPKTKLEELMELRQAAEVPDSDQDWNSVKKILAGDLDLAIKELIEFERINPGEYSTAANLGTAYELIGDNKQALKWISEAINRNPESHDGTEWLHQLILETKIQLEASPNAFENERVIPLPEYFDITSKVTIGGTQYDINEIGKALEFQLHERLVFVKPRDVVVSELLFSLARILAHTTTVEAGIDLLELSNQYGFKDKALLDKTMAEYQAAIQWRKIKGRVKITLGILAVIGFLYIAYKKKWIVFPSDFRKRTSSG